MKKIGFVATALLAFVFVSKAQTADEIVDNYAKTMGGRENWEKIKSMEFNGTASQMGMEFPMKFIMKEPNKFKTEINVMDKNLIFAFDGKEGWSVNPFQGSGVPEKMTEEQSKEMQDENSMSQDLMFYKKNGHKVELLGTEELEGTPVYKIKFTKKEGDVTTYFIDKDTYLLIAERSKSKSPEAKDVEVDQFFSDYKQVGNLLMPHFMEQKMQGQSVMKTTIKEYKLNTTIDDAIFAFPTK